MVYSMTGFGRSDLSHNGYRITAEIRSVNNRYLDLNIKLPRRLGMAEAPVRALLKDYIKRGKVDVFITCEGEEGTGARVKYNRQIAGEYLASLRQMAADFDLEDDVHLAALARFPDVFTTEEEAFDEDAMLSGVLKAAEEACLQFVAAREREGAFLKADLLEKLALMEQSVAFIVERSPQIIEEYKASLRGKIADLMGDRQIDEGRLATEITIFADKICVDEELVRLSSHIRQVRQALSEGDEAEGDPADSPDAVKRAIFAHYAGAAKDGIGRKLDFIAQEMNREANTILSKSTDTEVSDCGIGLKTTIEKVREQIQNVE